MSMCDLRWTILFGGVIRAYKALQATDVKLYVCVYRECVPWTDAIIVW